MTTAVLVLSWDAGGRGGPSARAAGLAVALAGDGVDVRVVTRLAEGERPPVLTGCEVNAVPDTAPVLPTVLESDELHALAFASPALAVTTRRLRDRPVDLTFADGAGSRDVATRLGERGGLVAADVADVAGPTVGVPSVGGRVRPAGTTPPAAVRSMAASLPAAVLTVPTGAAADRLARQGVEAVVVPGCAPVPRRRPGPPPRSGPVRLVAAPDETHRRSARRVRAVLRTAGATRTVTAGDRDRPAVCVVLDPDRTDDVLRAAARGVPVVTVPGRSGEAAAALGCGVVVPDEAAADACARLLADPRDAARLGAAGVDATGRAAASATAVLRTLLEGRRGPAHPALRAVR